MIAPEMAGQPVQAGEMLTLLERHKIQVYSMPRSLRRKSRDGRERRSTQSVVYNARRR